MGRGREVGEQTSVAALSGIAQQGFEARRFDGMVAAVPCDALPVDEETPASTFAHPAEFDLARILSFYHVKWVYEPTSFHLNQDADGRPTQKFTPDFYLPDDDLYIELTTMRQCLVTRKNKKIRRLRERYPSVQVRVLYRRDYDRLLGTFPLPDTCGHNYQVCGTMVSSAEITDRIAMLTREISLDEGNSRINGRPAQSPTKLLGLGRDSKRLLAGLTTQLSLANHLVESDWISFSSYGTREDQRRVRIGRRPSIELEGSDIIVVTDIVSTGLSVTYLTKWLRRQGVKSVRVCSLLDRTDARIIDVPTDYVGFEAPNELLAGFGISVGRDFADLPDVSILGDAIAD